MSKSRKFRNIAAEDNGDVLDRAVIRITPTRIISFGDTDTDTEPHLLRADAHNV